MKTTIETIRAIFKANEDRARQIAQDACNLHLDPRDVQATGRDNGWSTMGIYEMSDGGTIIEDGRGWHATLPNGEEIFV